MSKEKLILAGKIVAKVREEGAKRIVLGADFDSIVTYCENLILELNGGIAWVQISPTTTAAHFSPTSVNNPIVKEGDLIKLDIGVHIDGFIADTATTVLIESCDEKDNELKRNLIQASKNALLSVEKIIKPGVRLSELGAAQFEEAVKLGFTTITNLCGHSVDRWTVHAEPSIPSYNNGNNTVLEEGQVIAIEPFVTNGKGLIHESGISTVFMVDELRNTRSPQGRQVLSHLQTRNGLPFATRDLEKKYSRAIAVLGLRDLERQGIIRTYPPLVEVSNSPVAQFEHTFIVGYGCITKSE